MPVGEFGSRLLRAARAGAEYVVRPRRFHEAPSEDDALPGELRGDPDRNPYQASSPFWLPRVLRGKAITPQDVFLELGSGAGLVLCQAARRPFGRVVGVEVSPQLADVARRNVELNRPRFRCPRVDLLTTDAASFEVPDDVSYVYLNNPFVGETFQRVVRNILTSIDRAPRRVMLIYANPQMAAALDATGRFELLRTYRDPRLRRPLGHREERLRVYAAGAQRQA